MATNAEEVKLDQQRRAVASILAAAYFIETASVLVATCVIGTACAAVVGVGSAPATVSALIMPRQQYTGLFFGARQSWRDRFENQEPEEHDEIGGPSLEW